MSKMKEPDRVNPRIPNRGPKAVFFIENGSTDEERKGSTQGEGPFSIFKKRYREVYCLLNRINIFLPKTAISITHNANMKEGVQNLSNVTNEDHVHGNGEAVATEESPAKQKLRRWLNRHLRIKMTDGRVLTGAFLCTDRDANVILGSCSEFLSEDHTEARALGLVMVPGRHIVTIHLDV